MAIYAWSDIHVDYPQNLKLIESLSKHNFGADTILVAGDVTDRLDLLERTLVHLSNTFKSVYFVPGNHDLWLRKKDFECSTAKCEHILSLCELLGVQTGPGKIESADEPSVWLVPLFSWYTKPEHGECSLYIPKVGEDHTLSMWMDTHRIKWTSLRETQDPAHYFAEKNQITIDKDYDAPIISFSHFMPLKSLILPEGMPQVDIIPPYDNDPYPSFNFTSVAGSTMILDQIKQLGSVIHYYGHQHRNRQSKIDNVNYISHCMGYPQEDPNGPTGNKREPLQIWPPKT